MRGVVKEERENEEKKCDRGKQQQQLIEGARFSFGARVACWRSFLRDERQAEDVVFLRFRCSNDPFLLSTTEAETQQVDKIWPSSVIRTRSLITTTTILTTNNREKKISRKKRKITQHS